MVKSLYTIRVVDNLDYTIGTRNIIYIVVLPSNNQCQEDLNLVDFLITFNLILPFIPWIYPFAFY